MFNGGVFVRFFRGMWDRNNFDNGAGFLAAKKASLSKMP